ncbi:Flavonol 3-O-glucosyltransferase protein [Dioscorea alata]|uniref:Flavonol 3-O-glucosyltransferase protein n=1 Tax=Dioscorea alata TaxID=55571 RepID=A0ACB7WNQ6_DIOAL|nr:Flavonol 3-O-glucosyltransferase protein [Dioscorea alata]
MDSGEPLHVLFFPFLARSHMIPMLETARLFSDHGVKTSIVTTPANAHLIHPLLHHHPSISLHLIPFPSTTFNLPSGCENLTVLPLHLATNFFSAVFSLRDPLSHLISSLQPNAIISDALYTWTTELAGEFHIPRVIFQVTGLFPLSAANDLDLHRPYNSISDDSELFSIPGFPHTVHLTRSQLPEVFSFPLMLGLLREAELSSHAVIVNSFYALEPDYAVHYSNVAAREVFLLGPVAIAGQPEKKEKKAEPCLEWLDEKDDGSVVYVGFGTLSRFTAEQIKELAFGLENSGEGFVWAVGSGEVVEWIPEGFEKRVQGRGLVVKGWAPQTEILNHRAVGGFVCHCGWNSVMEAVVAGVPVITWPLHSEQFVIEKWVCEVVKMGIPAWEGFKSVKDEEKVVFPATAVATAVKRLMGSGEEVVEMRKRVAEVAKLAKMAVAKGGTSNEDLSRLIDGLVAWRDNRRPIK